MFIRSNKAIKRPFALDDRPYYPLVRVRPLNTTPKFRTANQIRDYCLQNGLPSVLDKWIEEGRVLSNLLWSDKVECQLSVKVEEGPAEGPFGDPDKFTLFLKVQVPPTAGFLTYYSDSPVIVIAKYTGEKDDDLAPGWIGLVAPQAKFWQPRTMMPDFILHFAMRLPENERTLEHVKAWCRAISVPASGMSTSVWGGLYFDPIEVKNTRRHKPRASDLSAEESKRLRREINEGSPLKRSTRLRQKLRQELKEVVKHELKGTMALRRSERLSKKTSVI